MRRNHHNNNPRRRRFGRGYSSGIDSNNNNNMTRWWSFGWRRWNNPSSSSIILICFLLLVTIQSSSSLLFVSSSSPSGNNDNSPTTTTNSDTTKTTSSISNNNNNDDDDDDDDDNEDALSLRVIELTSTDYTTKVGDGNVWLIEFFTPWCRHCQNFAHSYASVASKLHSNPSGKNKIRVSKVDCSVEKALCQRFNILSYPSFYVVDGWSVYEFDEHRSESNLINFVKGGYMKKEPVPLWISPMGPMGLLQGFLIYMGTVVMNFFQSIQDGYGISPLIAGVVLCGLGMFLGVCSIIVLTIMTTPKAKES